MTNPITIIGIKEMKTSLTFTRILIPVLIISSSLIPQITSIIQGGDKLELYSVLFLSQLIPVIIVYQVGTNVFLNEIRWKTIKSLLATPISDLDILLGKGFASITAGLCGEAILDLLFLFVLRIETDACVYLILFGIGPLLVVYSTLLIVAASAKFPVSESYGKSSIITLGGIMLVFLLGTLLQGIAHFNAFLSLLIVFLIVASMTLGTLILSLRFFNRENLVITQG